MPNHPQGNRVSLMVAATACWGVGTVATKQVLDRDVDALTLLPIQLGASCALLLVATVATLVNPVHRRSTGVLTWSPQLTKLGVLGVLNPGLAYALGLLGLANITASMSVLIWAVEPVLILLLAAAILRERVGRALVIFLAVAVVGVVLVVYQPHASGNAAGVALTFAAVGSCALYTVLTRRLLLNDASLIVVLVQQGSALAFALVLATVVRLVSREAWNLGSVSASTWALAALSGALYYGMAFWFYLAALRQLPASVAGAFLPMIPIFGMAAAYVIGERLTERQLAGAALVVLATGLLAVSQARDST